MEKRVIGSDQRFTIDVASHQPFLTTEQALALHPTKPKVTFGAAAARPTLKAASAIQPDAPALHPSIDAVRPSVSSAFIAPPPSLPSQPRPSTGAAAPAPPKILGPGEYEPSLELVTRRTLGGEFPKQATHRAGRQRSRSPSPLPQSRDPSPPPVQLSVPFNSSSSRSTLAKIDTDERAPLQPNPELLKRAAPAFSFGTSAARPILRAEDDGEDTDAEDAMDNDASAPTAPSYGLVERRTPAASFGLSERFRSANVPPATTEVDLEDLLEQPPAPATPPSPSTGKTSLADSELLRPVACSVFRGWRGRSTVLHTEAVVVL